MAATRMPKLKLMLSDETVFLRTKIEVNTVREYLARTDNQAPERPLHPAQILSQKNSMGFNDTAGAGTTGGIENSKIPENDVTSSHVSG